MTLTLPLIFCLIATVIPVFFGKISSAPTWLSLQALALGWITLNNAGEVSAHAALVGLEVLLVRAILVPQLLRRALRKQTNSRMSLMPSNLFAWIIAVMLIILAFKFGDGARADARALTLGVVAATVVIAFLILSTNHEPKAQLVAVLFMENAVQKTAFVCFEPDQHSVNHLPDRCDAFSHGLGIGVIDGFFGIHLKYISYCFPQ